MERTRFFRRPVVWIVLVIIGAIALSTLFNGGQSYTQVTTSELLGQLKGGNVSKALIEDKEQTIDFELKNAATFNGASTKKIKAQIPALSVNDVFAKINDAKAAGKTIYGLGAPVKGNTLLNYCSLGAGEISWIGDSTPLKQGLLTPGSHIPIRADSTILAEGPPYTLLLAWNYADSILRRFSSYTESGGRFIHPIPLARLLPP